jgi:DNA-binding HxlR family transcriptional regulator
MDSGFVRLLRLSSRPSLAVMNPTASFDALSWSIDGCTIGRAMEVLGEKWTVVVLREVFNGVRRFDDMRVRTGIPRQVLANRLAMLVDQGVLRREPYREPGARERHEYRLTRKGIDVYPVLITLLAWGNRYLADPGGPPLRFTHRECGAEVHAEIHCSDGHRLEDPRDVVPRPGPGARRR